MDAPGLRCAVTGATGYVGSRVSDYFATRGWTVFELARRPRKDAESRVHVPFQLDSAIPPVFFRDRRIRTLVHCAYDFRATEWEEIERVNVDGSVRLLRAARDGGVETIILLSSISAFDGCSSLYGKAKLAVEKAAADVGAFIVRPGLVYGGHASGGVFGSLQRLASRSSVIPMIGTGRYLQYLAHEDDLCELLFRIATGAIPFTPAPIVAAGARAWSMRDLLRALRAERGLSVWFVPIPWRALWVALRVGERCGLSMPFRSDSVISLVRQNPAPDFSVLSRTGLRFREFTARP